jgi:hypothetical protein
VFSVFLPEAWPPAVRSTINPKQLHGTSCG